jgi:hypothetical protein
MPEISLIDRLAPLIDERCGIIRRVRRFIFPPGFEGQMHGFTAFLGRPAALHPGPSRTGSKLGSLTGSGTAVDETTAQIRGGAARDAALARRSRARPRAAAALLCARAGPRALGLPPARARSGSRRALGARLLALPRAPDLGAAHGDVHGVAAADPRPRALPALDGVRGGRELPAGDPLRPVRGDRARQPRAVLAAPARSSRRSSAAPRPRARRRRCSISRPTSASP